jgi:murein L,D-transpeptidase YafK
MVKRLALAAGLALALAGCGEQQFSGSGSTRHLAPIPPATLALMAEKGVSKDDPILIRAYKKEAELEVWKRGRDGRYAHLKTFPICRWSGQLGPKVKEGDRQAPEGFYQVSASQLNPNSSFYLSFDTGYPNAFDRAHGRTGSHLMVHGSCSSRGCFAMTDEAIAEIYAIARESLSSGSQRSFQFQSYPFRMTAQNLARHRYDPHIAFWKNLKEGSDHFEVTKAEPQVAVCGRRYAFNAPNCGNPEPEIAQLVARKQAEDEQKVAEIVAKGTPAVKLVYEDGGGHPSFGQVAVAQTVEDSGSAFPVLQAAAPRRNLGDVSRPEALAMGPREVLLESPGRAKPETALAFAPNATPRADAARAPGARPSAPAAAPVVAAAPAKPDQARPAPSRVASADEPVVVPPPAMAAQKSAGDTRSLYQRMMGMIGRAEEPASAPVVEAPLPGRRSDAPARTRAN